LLRIAVASSWRKSNGWLKWDRHEAIWCCGDMYISLLIDDDAWANCYGKLLLLVGRNTFNFLLSFNASIEPDRID